MAEEEEERKKPAKKTPKTPVRRRGRSAVVSESELQAANRPREYTDEQLIQSVLDRIDDVDGVLGVIIEKSPAALSAIAGLYTSRFTVFSPPETDLVSGRLEGQRVATVQSEEHRRALELNWEVLVYGHEGGHISSANYDLFFNALMLHGGYDQSEDGKLAAQRRLDYLSHRYDIVALHALLYDAFVSLGMPKSETQKMYLRNHTLDILERMQPIQSRGDDIQVRRHQPVHELKEGTFITLETDFDPHIGMVDSRFTGRIEFSAVILKDKATGKMTYRPKFSSQMETFDGSFEQKMELRVGEINALINELQSAAGAFAWKAAFFQRAQDTIDSATTNPIRYQETKVRNDQNVEITTWEPVASPTGKQLVTDEMKERVAMINTVAKMFKIDKTTRSWQLRLYTVLGVRTLQAQRGAAFVFNRIKQLQQMKDIIIQRLSSPDKSPARRGIGINPRVGQSAFQQELVQNQNRAELISRLLDPTMARFVLGPVSQNFVNPFVAESDASGVQTFRGINAVNNQMRLTLLTSEDMAARRGLIDIPVGFNSFTSPARAYDTVPVSDVVVREAPSSQQQQQQPRPQPSAPAAESQPIFVAVPRLSGQPNEAAQALTVDQSGSHVMVAAEMKTEPSNGMVVISSSSNAAAITPVLVTTNNNETSAQLIEEQKRRLDVAASINNIDVHNAVSLLQEFNVVATPAASLVAPSTETKTLPAAVTAALAPITTSATAGSTVVTPVVSVGDKRKVNMLVPKRRAAVTETVAPDSSLSATITPVNPESKTATVTPVGGDASIPMELISNLVQAEVKLPLNVIAEEKQRAAEDKEEEEEDSDGVSSGSDETRSAVATIEPASGKPVSLAEKYSIADMAASDAKHLVSMISAQTEEHGDEEEDEDIADDEDEEEEEEEDEEEDADNDYEDDDDGKDEDLENESVAKLRREGDYITILDGTGKNVQIQLLSSHELVEQALSISRIADEANELFGLDLVYPADNTFLTGNIPTVSLQYRASDGAILDKATQQVLFPYYISEPEDGKSAIVHDTSENEDNAVFTNYTTMRKAELVQDEKYALVYLDYDRSKCKKVFVLPRRFFRVWSSCVACTDRFLVFGLNSLNAVMFIDLVKHTSTMNRADPNGLEYFAVNDAHIIRNEVPDPVEDLVPATPFPLDVHDVAVISIEKRTVVFSRTGNRVRAYSIIPTDQTTRFLVETVSILCPELTSFDDKTLTAQTAVTNGAAVKRDVVIVNDSIMSIHRTPPVRQFCATAKPNRKLDMVCLRLFLTPQYFIGVDPSKDSEYMTLCRISMPGRALPLSYFSYIDRLRQSTDYMTPTGVGSMFKASNRYKNDITLSNTYNPEDVASVEGSLALEHLIAIYMEAVQHGKAGTAEEKTETNMALAALFKKLTGAPLETDLTSSQQETIALINKLFQSSVTPYNHIADDDELAAKPAFILNGDDFGAEVQLAHLADGLHVPYITFTVGLDRVGQTTVVCATEDFVSVFVVVETLNLASMAESPCCSNMHRSPYVLVPIGMSALYKLDTRLSTAELSAFETTKADELHAIKHRKPFDPYGVGAYGAAHLFRLLWPNMKTHKQVQVPVGALNRSQKIEDYAKSAGLENKEFLQIADTIIERAPKEGESWDDVKFNLGPGDKFKQVIDFFNHHDSYSMIQFELSLGFVRQSAVPLDREALLNAYDEFKQRAAPIVKEEASRLREQIKASGTDLDKLRSLNSRKAALDNQFQLNYDREKDSIAIINFMYERLIEYQAFLVELETRIIIDTACFYELYDDVAINHRKFKTIREMCLAIFKLLANPRRLRRRKVHDARLLFYELLIEVNSHKVLAGDKVLPNEVTMLAYCKDHVFASSSSALFIYKLNPPMAFLDDLASTSMLMSTPFRAELELPDMSPPEGISLGEAANNPVLKNVSKMAKKLKESADYRFRFYEAVELVRVLDFGNRVVASGCFPVDDEDVSPVHLFFERERLMLKPDTSRESDSDLFVTSAYTYGSTFKFNDLVEDSGAKNVRDARRMLPEVVNARRIAFNEGIDVSFAAYPQLDHDLIPLVSLKQIHKELERRNLYSSDYRVEPNARLFRWVSDFNYSHIAKEWQEVFLSWENRNRVNVKEKYDVLAPPKDTFSSLCQNWVYPKRFAPTKVTIPKLMANRYMTVSDWLGNSSLDVASGFEALREAHAAINAATMTELAQDIDDKKQRDAKVDELIGLDDNDDSEQKSQKKQKPRAKRPGSSLPPALKALIMEEADDFTSFVRGSLLTTQYSPQIMNMTFDNDPLCGMTFFGVSAETAKNDRRTPGRRKNPDGMPVDILGNEPSPIRRAKEEARKEARRLKREEKKKKAQPAEMAKVIPSLHNVAEAVIVNDIASPAKKKTPKKGRTKVSAVIGSNVKIVSAEEMKQRINADVQENIAGAVSEQQSSVNAIVLEPNELTLMPATVITAAKVRKPRKKKGEAGAEKESKPAKARVSRKKKSEANAAAPAPTPSPDVIDLRSDSSIKDDVEQAMEESVASSSLPISQRLDRLDELIRQARAAPNIEDTVPVAEEPAQGGGGGDEEEVADK